MSKRIQELRQQRGEQVTAMRAILDTARRANRVPTAEEEAEYDRIDKAQEKLGAELRAEETQAETARAREDRVATLEREMASRAPDSRPARTEPLPAPVTIEAGLLTINGQSIALDDLSASERELLTIRASTAYRSAFGKFLKTARIDPKYQASLQADSDPAGGALVAPIQFINDVLKKVKDLVFIRAMATIQTVTQAQSLGVPTLEADPADADWTSELATGNEDTAMNVGRRELHPHPVAKLIKLSNKLLRLTAGGAETLVMDRLAYKFAITEEKAFLLGSGASQPLGVFTASASGISTARDTICTSATVIAADDLINAKYALKAPYRRGAVWCFHRDAVKAIRKLKDTNGQYLWSPSGLGQASLADAGPDLILGLPYYESEYVPNTFTTGLYVGIVGNFSYYWIADALGWTVQRLVELYAATNQVGFIGRKETDGMPVFEEAFARVRLA